MFASRGSVVRARLAPQRRGSRSEAPSSVFVLIFTRHWRTRLEAESPPRSRSPGVSDRRPRALPAVQDHQFAGAVRRGAIAAGSVIIVAEYRNVVVIQPVVWS
jgi:hypothetical protein